jgi:hypothetical protein
LRNKQNEKEMERKIGKRKKKKRNERRKDEERLTAGHS